MYFQFDLKPYKELDCDCLETIQTKTLTLLNSMPEVFTNNGIWNSISTINVVKHIPELVEFCNSLNLKIRDTAVTIINENKPNLALHIDQLPVTAKLNIPILNTENYNLDWFSIERDYYSTLDLTKKDIFVDESRCKLLDSVHFVKPIIFNSAIPHRVVNNGMGIHPRIMLSCMFFKEPIEMLK